MKPLEVRATSGGQFKPGPIQSNHLNKAFGTVVPAARTSSELVSGFISGRVFDFFLQPMIGSDVED